MAEFTVIANRVQREFTNLRVKLRPTGRGYRQCLNGEPDALKGYAVKAVN
ncbi:TPA: hypothetical protein ACF6GW_004172 [Salmonella enterica]|nr:hypothetical protein [Salmonella enterica subsp. enterica serovar Paratyphi C]